MRTDQRPNMTDSYCTLICIYANVKIPLLLTCEGDSAKFYVIAVVTFSSVKSKLVGKK